MGDSAGRDGIADPRKRRFLLGSAMGGGAALANGGQPTEAASAPSSASATAPVPLALRVNGCAHQFRTDIRMTVLDVVQKFRELKGVKKGCHHGQCGACALLIDGKRELACRTLAVAAEGRDVVTIKGLATPDGALHREPGEEPHPEANLRPGKVVTAFIVPRRSWNRRSLHLKIHDRQAYECAVASVAVALDLEGLQVSDLRIALGGVAPRQWRAREAEDVLRCAAVDEGRARMAARAAFGSAVTWGHNGFKVALD